MLDSQVTLKASLMRGAGSGSCYAVEQGRVWGEGLDQRHSVIAY
jgi:hypothetical protein